MAPKDRPISPVWSSPEMRNSDFLITGHIVETERNSPIRRIFADHQFLFDEESESWILKLPMTDLLKPSWIRCGETPAEPVSASDGHV